MVFRPGDIIYLAGRSYPEGLPCEVLAVDDTGDILKIKSLQHDIKLGHIGFIYECEDLTAAMRLKPGGNWVATTLSFCRN